MNKKNLEFVSPVVRYGLSGPPINPKKIQVFEKEERIGNTGEGGSAMVIFAYNEKLTENKYITIEKETLCCVGADVYHVTFRNFPTLRIENLKLNDCRFENCNTIHFTDCQVDDCLFTGIETLYAENSPISGCDFTHLRCDNDCILCLEDSDISLCFFKDIALHNGSYLTNGVGSSWIESCRFENIRTDREDRVIIYCEETVGKIIKKKKQFCVVAEEGN